MQVKFPSVWALNIKHGGLGHLHATMLRIPFMQQWFGLSDPAMEEALHDVPLYRAFAGLP